jgi:CO/xanthine dehydrogenase FAD-binding subunit
MQDFDFLQPRSIEEMLALVDNVDRCVIAGGTDVIPRLARNGSTSSPGIWVDITRIADLRFLRHKANQVHIGALITHAEIKESPLLIDEAQSLVQAVSTIGCVQTRNRGTLGGNLANASPAADCAPPLLTLNARVHILGRNDERVIPLDQFFLSPGLTQLSAGEIIHSVSFDIPEGNWGLAFIKHGKRNGMAIAVASAAVALRLSPDGAIQEARVAVGSVAPTPRLCPSVEKELTGVGTGMKVFEQAAQRVVDDIAPIADVRATAAYRRHTAVVLVRRALEQAYCEAQRRAG